MARSRLGDRAGHQRRGAVHHVRGQHGQRHRHRGPGSGVLGIARRGALEERDACWRFRAPRRLNSTSPWRKSAWASGSAVSACAGAARDERPSVPSRVSATVRAISSCTANTFASGRSYFSRPAHLAVAGRQQRDGDPHLALGALDRAGEQRGDLQLAGDRAVVESLGLQRGGAGAPDHPHPVLGERPGDLLGEADAEVVVILVAAQVREREHRQRAVGGGARRRARRSAGRSAHTASGGADQRRRSDDPGQQAAPGSDHRQPPATRPACRRCRARSAPRRPRRDAGRDPSRGTASPAPPALAGTSGLVAGDG